MRSIQPERASLAGMVRGSARLSPSIIFAHENSDEHYFRELHFMK